ncbi:MAG: urease accessory protein UreE [Leptolyngbyaceae cyanobacterium RM2_2_4]|nr:urease accessory protein UreE [Leptolyngbyaceae cyanobacterium SM1_4_3]NJN91964.1 urease accessory protein UreE [Leptolyngbyaceae cyanobacterium SL_5_14]NJO51092.1 urease accessory protein UreE [Leptolyngbyaceae cyanobacterium RM2_2_4]
MLNLTQRLPADPTAVAEFTLALTAEERVRSRHYFHTDEQDFYLNLPRGTVLQDGDLLQTEADGRLVRISAKPEPVMTVMAQSSLDLLRAAYHLGNRHVPLEVTEAYLRFSPDPVLKAMLEQQGLDVSEDIAPLQPESGAYGHSHATDPHLHPPSTPAHPHAQ